MEAILSNNIFARIQYDITTQENNPQNFVAQVFIFIYILIN